MEWPKLLWTEFAFRDSSILPWVILAFLSGLIGTVGQLPPENGNYTEQIYNQTESEPRPSLQTDIAKPLELQRLGTNENETDHLVSSGSRRSRRSVVHLYDMVVCATGCNPLAYKGYGCYCGFLGSGLTVDGIDRCCQMHDWCYNEVQCPPLLSYFVPYYWSCTDSRPYCVNDYRGWKGICGTQLCECDRQFAECLRKYPCPNSRAMCLTSPWRFWQNLIMQPPLPYDYFDPYYR